MHDQNMAILKGLVSVAWADGRVADEELEVINPATEAPAGRVSMGSAVDVDRAARAARAPIAEHLGAQAMRDVAGVDWPPEVCLRAMQCSFVSVVEPGRVQVEVEVMRQGRNVCQVMARVIEGDLQGQGVKVAIVVSRFNGFITDRLSARQAVEMTVVGGEKKTAFVYETVVTPISATSTYIIDSAGRVHVARRSRPTLEMGRAARARLRPRRARAAWGRTAPSMPSR